MSSPGPVIAGENRKKREREEPEQPEGKKREREEHEQPKVIRNDRILENLKTRALRRRERDLVNPQPQDLEPGGIPDPNYRQRAMLTYAYDNRDGHFYVGYSGSAGGMTSHQQRDDHDMARRRYDRIADTLEAFDPERIVDRSIYNCGEAAALAVAMSWGARLEDLVFASFNTNGRLVPPCANCQQWVQHWFGE